MIKEKAIETTPKLSNRYDLMEWAGAFGDLGTLIPFIVAYISIVKINPTGILLIIGMSLIFSGVYYKTPIPVQPMKAIGAVAITKAGITAGMIWGASLFTGFLWLVLGFTNVIKYVGKLAKKPVVTGIIIGLGVSFIREAFKLMSPEPYLAMAGIILTFVLMGWKRVPAIFILLCSGATYTLVTEPGLISELSKVKLEFNLPSFTLTKFNITELTKGVLLLALPQIPLTVGNGVVAITSENNSLFPQHPVNERKISLSTGLMNIVSAAFGGIPICHGAGGMAGHVRFGAKTGGSLVILGTILTFLALFLSSSVLTLFNILPQAILGVILLFAGMELLKVVKKVEMDIGFIVIMTVTGLLSVFNVGIGFVGGLLLYYVLKILTKNKKAYYN